MLLRLLQILKLIAPMNIKDLNLFAVSILYCFCFCSLFVIDVAVVVNNSTNLRSVPCVHAFALLAGGSSQRQEVRHGGSSQRKVNGNEQTKVGVVFSHWFGRNYVEPSGTLSGCVLLTRSVAEICKFPRVYFKNLLMLQSSGYGKTTGALQLGINNKYRVVYLQCTDIEGSFSMRKWFADLLNDIAAANEGDRDEMVGRFLETIVELALTYETPKQLHEAQFGMGGDFSVRISESLVQATGSAFAAPILAPEKSGSSSGSGSGITENASGASGGVLGVAEHISATNVTDSSGASGDNNRRIGGRGSSKQRFLQQQQQKQGGRFSGTEAVGSASAAAPQ